MGRLFAVLAIALLAACKRDEPLATPPLPAAQPEPATAPSGIQAGAAPELDALFKRRGLQGVVALLDADATTARCNDVAACNRLFTPASTFKIPNSIIGLETGVIPDADFMIPWDHKQWQIPPWNQDHTLRTAIRDSVVWYYQELARRVGPERMQEWLIKLSYGNERMGGTVDRFWLDGPLAITPLQQLKFLRKLARAELPISARTRDIVLDITKRGDVDGRPLHGKTGWANPGEPNEIGWFVGWLEDPTARRYVAVAILKRPQGYDMMRVRQTIAEEALRWQPGEALPALQPGELAQ